MNKLVSLLTWPRLITLFGVLALIALIWFGGPYVSIADYVPLESRAVRFLVILLLVVCIGLLYLIKQIQVARNSNKIIDDLADSAALKTPEANRMEQSVEEVDLLKKRFEEAMVVLKKSRKNDGAVSLYSLPWYIIIGPPAAGKTTALLNSGLKFPLEEQFGNGELKGVGGTRNCDWLFTDQAVLLDTAGRYVTQDSHAAMDSAAWFGFLNLLKKHRRRRPVNGVLVAVNLVDLMEQDTQAQESHIWTIKKRVQELYQHFGIRLPVYVLLTKSDRVAGFTEFFDNFGREERAQVWGFTLPLYDENKVPDLASVFNQEYDQLLARLNERLLYLLSQERDIKRRDLIFGFPRQMASLKPMLGEFLAAVFQPNPYEEPIMLRGVYLTSGTQEGRPIDRLMLNIARTFKLDLQLLPSMGKRGRSYFINRLLTDVVFKEAGLAGYDRRFETRRAWLQRVSYAGIVGITALAALGWFTSYSANTTYVTRVAKSLNDYQKIVNADGHGIDDAKSVLLRLDALLAANKIAGQYNDDVPVHMRFWLYQGNALNDAGMDAYKRELNSVFVPFIVKELERQLRRGSRDQRLNYETLKTYLMLGYPEKMKPDHVKDWMKQLWEKRFPREPSKQERLQFHLNNLLKGAIQPAVLDERLVKQVRGELKQLSYAGLIYERLNSTAMEADHSYFRTATAVGPSFRVVFTNNNDPDLKKGIPSLFTREGYYKLYLKESQRLVDVIRAEDWVLIADEKERADMKALEQLDKDIGRLYAADYIKEWEKMLSDTRIVRFKNIDHATEVLEVLISPASPLRRLLQVVEQNTALSRLPDGAQSTIGMLGKTSKIRPSQRLQDVLPDDTIVMPSTLAGTQIEEHFEPLNSLIQSNNGRLPPIEELMTALEDLYGKLIAMEGGYGDRNEQTMATSIGLQDLLVELDREGAKQREPIKSWMKQLVLNTQQISVIDARGQLNAAWQSSIQSECEKALNGRYPFRKDPHIEVTIDDFGRFFAPNGRFDQFFQQHLKSLVDTSQNIWQWKSKGIDTSGLSNDSLHQMQRASDIREAFFQDGGSIPRINFKIKPIFLDAKVKQFTLDLEGISYKYAFGPQITSDVQWPVPGGNNRVRIEFLDFNEKSYGISKDGPWAWFRILDQATKQRISPDRFIATFEVAGFTVKYEIRASSVINPFFMQDLEKFQCPREF